MAVNVDATLVDDTVKVTLRGAVSQRDLEGLARTLWARRTKAFLRQAGLTHEPPPQGWRAEAYVRRRARMVACGQSSGIRIQVRGMRAWNVTIIGPVTEAVIEEAANNLIRDQREKVAALKRTIWQSPGDLAARRRAQPRTASAQGHNAGQR
ncbi:hypothetical protein [Dactylosporangium sp. NPDC051541]|uniref:hypothetical protein n=1 Tax=Dactylosporangium sp. NPDC051541 TaxID=3363977 RepID=UPI0037A8A4CF